MLDHPRLSMDLGQRGWCRCRCVDGRIRRDQVSARPHRYSGRGGRVGATDQDVAVAALPEFEHGGDPGFPGGAGDNDR